ncbi:MAG: hypothetical protein QGG36_25875 [Pirellulaceae bacterium]|nr:hypothetical protein [Pirellulaceae bacterium]
MTQDIFALSAVDAKGVGLVVEFSRTADRVAHAVFAQRGDDRELLFQSVEGEDDDGWPSSPPFQEADMVDHLAEPALLLVGMAGKSHWSGSVEVESARRALVFDVACRVVGVKPRIGSEYVAPANHAQETSGEGIVFTSELLGVSGHLSGRTGNITAQRSSRENCRIDVNAAYRPDPQTVRWGYEFTVK